MIIHEAVRIDGEKMESWAFATEVGRTVVSTLIFLFLL